MTTKHYHHKYEYLYPIRLHTHHKYDSYVLESIMIHDIHTVTCLMQQHIFINFSQTTFKEVTWLVITEVRSKSFGLATERRHDIGVLSAISHIFAYWMSLTVMYVIFFNVECGIMHFLCVLRVFDIRASSSSPRPPLCQISFLLCPPLLS